MAKRRKTKSGGRRKVGAKLNASNPIVKYGSMGAGYFLGDKINAPIEKMVGTKVDGKIIGGAEALAGFLLAFGKGKKGMLRTVAGGLLIGAGAKKLMTEFGIGGIGPYGRVPVVAGAYGNVPVIARVGRGYTPSNQLGAYTPSSALNGRVMNGVGSYSGSGSGMTNSSPGSDHMN